MQLRLVGAGRGRIIGRVRISGQKHVAGQGVDRQCLRRFGLIASQIAGIKQS